MVDAIGGACLSEEPTHDRWVGRELAAQDLDGVWAAAAATDGVSPIDQSDSAFADDVAKTPALIQYRADQVLRVSQLHHRGPVLSSCGVGRDTPKQCRQELSSAPQRGISTIAGKLPE